MRREGGLLSSRAAPLHINLKFFFLQEPRDLVSYDNVVFDDQNAHGLIMQR